jgi:hypothetical protein
MEAAGVGRVKGKGDRGEYHQSILYAYMKIE